MDDANQTPGAPGECPGHEWVIHEVILKLRGAQMTVKCEWCGALQVEPSKNADFYEDHQLDDEHLVLQGYELLKRLEAEGGAPADVLLEFRQRLPPHPTGGE